MRTCSYEKCRSKNKKHYGKGLCASCWMRLRTRGTLEYAKNRAQKGCDVEGCEREHQAKGYCKRHYRSFRLYGDPTKVKPWGRVGCEYPTCTGTHWAKGLCRKHYMMRLDIIATTVKQPPLPGLDPAPFVAYLKAQGTTRRKVSECLGISMSTLRRYYNGEGLIRQANADRYCHALGIHPSMLWPDEWADAA